MFSLKYYPSQKYIEDADEIRIRYHRGDYTLEDFINKYQHKTIVIQVFTTFTDIDIKLLKGLSDKYGNIKIKLGFDEDDIDLLQEQQIPFFIDYIVSTPDELYDFIGYHPTDIYIGDELAFSLDKVSKMLHENGIQVRVVPNLCQMNARWLPSIKTFFIRPEDISIYSTFVDVFEIITHEKKHQETLFKVYKQEKWFGKLSDLITNFYDDLDNKYIIDSFGPIRSKCGKRCLLNPGSCNICDRLIQTAATLKDNKIVISRQKKTN